MPSLDIIKEPISSEIDEFDTIFSEVLNSDNPLLKSVYDYILDGKGKKLRPILTLLSAKLVGDINKTTHYSTFSLELIHTASLLHDDVIDDTYERRGKPSVNAKWNNKVAVLTGDYLLSKALYCANLTKNLDILESISTIGMVLSDGELLQLSYTNHQSELTEKEYIELIKRKTAKFFSTCAAVGAMSVNASLPDVEHLKKYGDFLGLCFQIKDDIFDYMENAHIGKPTGNDLRDGKLTIPMIYALRNDESETKKDVIDTIKNKNFTNENIHKLTQYAIDKGGLDYSIQLMEKYKQCAINELINFKESPAKNSLIACLDFVTDRNF